MEEAEDTEAVLAVGVRAERIQIQIEETKGRMRYLERPVGYGDDHGDALFDELSRPVEIAQDGDLRVPRSVPWRPCKRIPVLVDASIWAVIVLLPVVAAFIGLVVYGFVRLLGPFSAQEAEAGARRAEAHTEGGGA